MTYEQEKIVRLSKEVARLLKDHHVCQPFVKFCHICDKSLAVIHAHQMMEYKMEGEQWAAKHT